MAFQAALLRAMTFMIVASPCAVVLATMPPLLASIANAGRHGVLVKSAAAENPSEHPLGRAVVAAVREAGLPLAHAEEFTACPGRGVTARVAGRLVEIGGPAHLLGAAASHPAGGALAGLEETGQTAAVVRVDGTAVALLGIAAWRKALNESQTQ